MSGARPASPGSRESASRHAAAGEELLADRPADYEQWTEDKNRLAERRTMIEARARWAFALGLTGTKDPAAARPSWMP